MWFMLVEEQTSENHSNKCINVLNNEIVLRKTLCHRTLSSQETADCDEVRPRHVPGPSSVIHYVTRCQCGGEVLPFWTEISVFGGGKLSFRECGCFFCLFLILWWESGQSSSEL